MDDSVRNKIFEAFQCQQRQAPRFHSKWSQKRTFYKNFLGYLRFPTIYASDGSESTECPLPSPLPELRKPALYISDEEVEHYISRETGADRIRALFQKDLYDRRHPDLNVATGVCQMAGLTCFCVFSILGARQAKEEFIRSHRHVKFATKYRALRAYQDAMVLGSLKTGLGVGLRVSVFTFIFLSTSTLIATYRNKTTPFEYSAGGILSGVLFKINLGPRGMMAGGLIGGALGLVGGVLMASVQYAAGDTQNARHAERIREMLLQKKEAELIASGQLPEEEKATMHLVHVS